MSLKKYVILDRDGTINKDSHGYVHRLEEFELLPGVIEGLLQFKEAGFEFIIITNQAGIARAKYTEDDMHAFNRRLTTELLQYDITIAAILFCPHHPHFSGACRCRKPDIGLVQQAQKMFDFDTSQAIFIGDKDSDIQLGRNCNGITIRVICASDDFEHHVQPDFVASDLSDAFHQLRTAGVV